MDEDAVAGGDALFGQGGGGRADTGGQGGPAGFLAVADEAGAGGEAARRLQQEVGEVAGGDHGGMSIDGMAGRTV